LMEAFNNEMKELHKDDPISEADYSSEFSSESDSSSSYERDVSPPRHKHLRKHRQPIQKRTRGDVKVPRGFERTRCKAGHCCNNKNCWTDKKDPRIIWDRSRYSHPFYPSRRRK